MNKMKRTNSKSLFTSFCSILITLIFLIQAESTLCVPSEFSYYPHQTEIELVVTTETEYKLSLFKIDATPKQSFDFAVAHIDFKSICKLTLLNYDKYLRHQFKYFKRSLSPNNNLLSILQKHNAWHQSSDEDSVL